MACLVSLNFKARRRFRDRPIAGTISAPAGARLVAKIKRLMFRWRAHPSTSREHRCDLKLHAAAVHVNAKNIAGTTIFIGCAAPLLVNTHPCLGVAKMGS
jgi:hypothetical protein